MPDATGIARHGAGRLDTLFERAQQDVASGVLPSCQVALARRGELLRFETYGTAVQGGVERPATSETLFSIFSATKAIVAVAVWTLFEEALLRPEDAVADHIPEFATNGKEVVTTQQTMLHTGGFPTAPLGPRDWGTREGRLAAFSRWRLNWEPGSQYQYHPTSAHWVLAELIARLTGQDFRRYIRERLIGPLGLENLYLGLPDDLNERVAGMVYVEEPQPPPGGFGEVRPDILLTYNEPDVRAVGVPGAGGIGRAAELALFYQVLLNGGAAANGAQVVKPETIEWATKVRTAPHHLEPLTGVPANRGLGVIVAGDDEFSRVRGFGERPSARAFGHSGAGGQVAWADPETGISFAYCTNGFVDPLKSAQRSRKLSTLASACGR